MKALAIFLLFGKPVDFDAVERTIAKQPECNRPLYGLFLFGDKRVWALKVFVGRRGSKRGAICSSDDKFLPPGEYVQATLIYKAVDGKRKRYEAKLTERC